MLHEEGHTFVAEEGPYSASTSNLPVLQVRASTRAVARRRAHAARGR